MDNSFQETADLREYPNGQCEFVFNFKRKFNFGLLEQVVAAKRQASDTVESLLNHIVNKIKKSIKDMNQDANIKIDISLTDTIRDNIRPSTTLTNLVKNAVNLEFAIFKQRFFVLINAPIVKEMRLPDLIYSNSDVLPIKFVVYFAERNKCQFSWYKSANKKDWQCLPSKHSKYRVDEDDIGCYLKLKCVPGNSTMTGTEFAATSKNVIEKARAVPSCPFEDRHKYTRSATQGKTFRLISYNVLSERYADTAKFPYCSPNALSSHYRKQLISKELLGYQADIICLQEVDLTLYNTYYKECFNNKGYLSFFHRKGEAISEGLAIFFLASRFQLIQDYQILFRVEINNPRNKLLFDCLRSNTEIFKDFLKQHTSLHVTVLRMEDHVVIVANTHLFYRPDAKLVRLIQISLATSHLSVQQQKYARKGKKVSVIVCGDFNSHPRSAVFQFMTQGRINTNHEVFNEAKIKTQLTHSFGFESVYGTPKYTNYTDEFKDCLDYIFVQKSALNVRSVVPLFDDDVLGKYTGLPNEVFPSDHLALVSDLDLL